MMGGAATMMGDLNCIWVLSRRETSPLSSYCRERGIGGTLEHCRVTFAFGSIKTVTFCGYNSPVQVCDSVFV